MLAVAFIAQPSLKFLGNPRVDNGGFGLPWPACFSHAASIAKPEALSSIFSYLLISLDNYSAVLLTLALRGGAAMGNARVRITVERFDVQLAGTDGRYLTEIGNEKLLITCAPPDAVGLQLMKEQVLACLGGYQPEPFTEKAS